MVYATLAAGTDRGRDYHILGVPDWLHRQPGTGVARVGLQRDARERPGTDMPAVYSVMDSGITGRDIHGRLFKIRNLGKRKTALLHVETQDSRKSIKETYKKETFCQYSPERRKYDFYKKANNGRNEN